MNKFVTLSVNGTLMFIRGRRSLHKMLSPHHLEAAAREESTFLRSFKTEVANKSLAHGRYSFPLMPKSCFAALRPFLSRTETKWIRKRKVTANKILRSLIGCKKRSQLSPKFSEWVWRHASDFCTCFIVFDDAGQFEPVEPFKGAFSAPKKGLKDEVIVRRLWLGTSA